MNENWKEYEFVWLLDISFNDAYINSLFASNFTNLYVLLLIFIQKNNGQRGLRCLMLRLYIWLHNVCGTKLNLPLDINFVPCTLFSQIYNLICKIRKFKILWNLFLMFTGVIFKIKVISFLFVMPAFF